MNKKSKENLQKFFKSEIKKPVKHYQILAIILFSVIISSIAFYWIGHADAEKENEKLFFEEKKASLEADLLNQPLPVVTEIFWKFVMIKIMMNWPLTVGLICAGLFIRAIV